MKFISKFFLPLTFVAFVTCRRHSNAKVNGHSIILGIDM